MTLINWSIKMHYGDSSSHQDASNSSFFTSEAFPQDGLKAAIHYLPGSQQQLMTAIADKVSCFYSAYFTEAGRSNMFPNPSQELQEYMQATCVNLAPEELTQLKKDIQSSLMKRFETESAKTQRHHLPSFDIQWFSGSDINEDHPLKTALKILATHPLYKGRLYNGLLFDQERSIRISWNLSDLTCSINIGKACGFSMLI